MTNFSRATDAESIAESIIPEHHPELAKAEVKIAFIFRDTAAKTGGKVILGKAAKLAARARFIADYAADAVIEIAEDKWNTLSDTQRRALVDHELCHLEVVKEMAKIKVGEQQITITNGPDIGKVKTVPVFEEHEVVARDVDGRPKLKMRAHDLEEFACIVERHGLWTTDVLAMAEAISKAKKPEAVESTTEKLDVEQLAADVRLMPFDQLEQIVGILTMELGNRRIARNVGLEEEFQAPARTARSKKQATSAEQAA